MLKPLLTFTTIMSSLAMALGQTIHLPTEKSQMTFQVTPEKKLSRTYYGAKLQNPEDALLSSNSRTIAYPTRLDEQMYTKVTTDSCVSITQADGKVSLDLVYDSHEVTKPSDTEELAVFTLKDPHYPVKVKLFILAHKDTNVYEQWVEIINEGKEPISVDKSASAHLEMKADKYFVNTMSGAWASESILREEVVAPGNTLEAGSNAGTRDSQHGGSPAFIISLDQPAQENSGEVYMGALAWSGSYKFRYMNKMPAQRLTASFGINSMDSPYTLDGGKTLTLPKCIFTHSTEGKGLATRQIHDWARKHGIQGADKERLTLLNSWEGAYFTFDEPLLHGMMERAAGMGVELFVLDDGWFGNKHPRNGDGAGLGDWDVNEKKLPNGVPGLVKAAEDRKIKFGIWVEPEMVNPKSELYEKHPDWVIELPHREKRTMRNQLGLDLANPAVQEYIIGFMTKLLKDNPNICYIKWDCNRNITDPGSNYLDAKHQKNLYVDYVQGYYKVMDTLIKAFPDVVFQACSSGGGRADYGAMKYHHEFWVSDNTDPVERIFMQWAVGHVFPAITMASHVTESPNHQTGRVTPLKFRFDVAMTGRLGFELQPQKLSEADVAFSKKALAEYKRIRPIVQMGDLYRLRSPYEGPEASLMYSLEKDGKQQVIFFAYLLEKMYGDKFSPIKLQGLKSDKRYLVKAINVEGDNTRTTLHEKVVGGDYLMKEGIAPQWRRPLDSLVLEITEQ